MKNNKYIISILAIFVLMFVSCKNYLNNTSIEKDLENNDVASKTAKLYFSVNGQSARNIFPDTSLANFSNFVLKGVHNNSENISDLGAWDDIQAVLAASIDIDAGSWNLTLTAKRGEINFTSNAQIEVSEGQSITASFVLVAAGTNNGIANITLRFPEKAEIGEVEWEFKKVQNSSNFSYWSDTIEGSYPEERIPFYERIQSLTNNSYTLQTELPAGRYIFSCQLCSGMGAPVGSYYDYIVIQPGLESKLDYTIDYLEFTGITDIVPTEQGMLLTIEVPKGVEMLTIIRLNNYAQMGSFMEEYANNPDPNIDPYSIMESFITIINKQLDAKTTSNITLQFLDSYGYKEEDELTYTVCFDYNFYSFGSSMKTITVPDDGLDFPEFTTYPEFATETNNDGVTTKISISNDPVVDWKGNEINGGYKLLFGENFFGEGKIFPDCVVDGNTKEGEVDIDNLNPGSTILRNYRFGFEKNGWNYDFYCDMSVLSGAQLPPVLQGPSPAKATADGISIKVYIDGYNDVSLLRAESVDGSWEKLMSDIEVDRGYFEYTDKYDLTAGTTYYYKVINNKGETFGGEYFSATSTVTKEPICILSAQPILTVSNDAVASFVMGTYQVADTADVKIIHTVYEFVEENAPDNTLEIRHVHDQTREDPDINKLDGIYSTPRSGYKLAGTSDSLNLYRFILDGKKFILSAVYFRFCNAKNYLIREFDFTPEQGKCPSEIQIPNKKIGLELTATNDGIVISITNIPEEIGSLSIRSAEEYDFDKPDNFQEDRNYSFNSNNYSGTMTFTDKYVNSNKQYYYKIYAYTNPITYESDVKYVTATGGAGEIEISVLPVCTFDSTDNTVTFTQAAQLTKQDYFPDDTRYDINFTYKEADKDYYSGASYAYSNSNLNSPIHFNAWRSGTYTPYEVQIYIQFPDYNYSPKKLAFPANSTLPQQVVVQ